MGWLILGALASVLALLSVIDAVWRLAHADWVGLLTLPVSLLFWYWIGAGAFRRARRRRIVNKEA